MDSVLIQCSNLKPKTVSVDKDYISIKLFEDNGTGKPKTFNPFDKMFTGDNPFIEFASIDTANLSNIKHFVEKYGVLDFIIDEELKSKDDLYEKAHSFVFSQIKKNNLCIKNNSPVYTDEYYKDLFSYGNDTFEIIGRRPRAYEQLSKIEKTHDFIHETKVMKCLFQLYKSKSINDLENYINELKMLSPDYTEEILMIEEMALKENKQNAINLVLVSNFITTKKMKNVEFSTDLALNKITKDYIIRPQYFVPTLLTGLYLMFYFHITNGGLIRQCHVCNKFYDNNNSGCSEECINVLSSRKYRAKKAKDPIEVEYEKQRKKMQARTKAKGDKRITKNEYNKWKNEAIKIRNTSSSIKGFNERINEINYK